MTAPRLYLDEHISFVVARILSSRKLDVLRTQDAGNLGGSDDQQLTYAAAHSRCLVSHNVKDFVRLHSEFIRSTRSHAGILLVMHDPRPSVVATRILMRLAAESGETLCNALMFA